MKISGKGWFTFTLSALASGEVEIDPDSFYYSVDDLYRDLAGIRAVALARHSRKGWWTVDHPDLGTVQWRQGTDFRSGGSYMFVRVNGVMILKAWPQGDGRYSPAIVCGPGAGPGAREIEAALGGLSR